SDLCQDLPRGVAVDRRDGADTWQGVLRGLRPSADQREGQLRPGDDPVRRGREAARARGRRPGRRTGRAGGSHRGDPGGCDRDLRPRLRRLRRGAVQGGRVRAAGAGAPGSDRRFMTDGLLLLHAWPVDARMWEPQLAALPDGLAVAAPDLPGFGGSEPAGDVLTMGAAAERALEALGERGIDRAVVCGLSMGGCGAFELWRRARDRVIGLVLANPRAVADPPEAAAARRALAERLRSEGNVLAEEPPALLSDRAPEGLRGGVRGGG